MNRIAEWDVDGLAVSCDACTNRNRCDECEEYREKFLAGYEAEQAALYFCGTGTTGTESSEQRAEWLRLKS